MEENFDKSVIETIWKDNNFEMYLKFDKNISYSKSSDSLPYVDFILGIKIKTGSWIGEYREFVGEDDFVLYGKDFINALKELIDNYKTKNITLTDDNQDTDAEIVFDCQESKIKIKGRLGATFESEYSPVLTFSYDVTSQILVNLHSAIEKHMIYEYTE